MTAYLADTNVVLRWALPHDPLSPPAANAVKLLRRRGGDVCVATQNLIEFWAVATRPAASNGLGMTPAIAATEIDRIAALFHVLSDTPAVFANWRRLVETCSVSGRQVHDARLAAVMLANGVSHVLTFNVEDFRRYSGIVVVNPHDM
ncbi:MAG: PIN domain-containing protein [Byssovorax sp.]